MGRAMRLIVVSIAALLLTFAARAQAPDCKSISDSLERLRCYDAQSAPSAQTPNVGDKNSPAKPPAPAEDPFIAKAKARVKQQLRDPESARFQSLKIKMVGGKKGLCGEV